MKQNTNGEMIFDEEDLCNLVMQGRNLNDFGGLIVDGALLENAASILDDVPKFIRYNEYASTSVEEFDHRCQNDWKMPKKYQELDIAEYVLALCKTDAELQRVGHELLMFQERDLFNLLRYLVFLVDLMQENRAIWGVGRGSSVASYVLYLIGVHRIDSMFYELDPAEFLR